MRRARAFAGEKKRAVKELTRLLRALSGDKALLRCVQAEDGKVRQLSVFGQKEGAMCLVLRPERQLVERCLKEDLLTKTDAGWVIGENGRLALKRMLAGAEPFSEQHQQRKIRPRKIEDVEQGVMVNDRASPLGWLARRKDTNGKPMISKTQFAAGERLACDFQFAGLMPRVTSSWAGPETRGQRRSAPGAGVLMSDNRLAARQRVRNAINEVGSDLADILLDICCFQLGLSDAEKTRGWPRRSGKIILRIALDRLADHYGMKSKISQDDRSRGSQISHWGVEDYKPS